MCLLCSCPTKNDGDIMHRTKPRKLTCSPGQRGARRDKPARNADQELWERPPGPRAARRTGVLFCLSCRKHHPGANTKLWGLRRNLALLPSSNRSQNGATAPQVLTMPFLCPCQLRLYSTPKLWNHHSATPQCPQTPSWIPHSLSSVCPPRLYVWHDQL